MKRSALDEDLVPVRDLRANLAHWLSELDRNGRPLVVTQRGRAAAVLVRPAALDELEEGIELVRKVLRGLSQSEGGDFVEDEQMWADVDAVIADPG